METLRTFFFSDDPLPLYEEPEAKRVRIDEKGNFASAQSMASGAVGSSTGVANPLSALMNDGPSSISMSPSPPPGPVPVMSSAAGVAHSATPGSPQFNPGLPIHSFAPLANNNQQAISTMSMNMNMDPMSVNLLGLAQQQQQSSNAAQLQSNNNIFISNDFLYDSEKRKQQELEERKKRNAEQARKSRQRKKNAEGLLQLELNALQRENEMLKNIVKSEMNSDLAQQVIGECCYHKSPNKQASVQPSSSSKNKWQLRGSDFVLIEDLTRTRQSFVLTDPRLPDNPIVYASSTFLELTGYKREEVTGRNCRFLQGIDTDHEAVQTIRDAVAAGTDAATCIRNYKADGTPFWNHFFVAPLHDRDNRVVNYVGIQTEVQKPEEISLEKSKMSSELKQVNGEEGTEEPVEPTKPVTLTQKLTLKTIEQRKRAKAKAEEEAAQRRADALKEPPPPQQQQDLSIIDWSQLAEVLEAEVEDPDGIESSLASEEMIGWDADVFDPIIEKQDAVIEDAIIEKAALSHFVRYPREMVQRTMRSEVIESLMTSNGDTSDPRFLSALELLSKMFKQATNEADVNTSIHPILHGHWKSISRPSFHYGGCVGKNDDGEFLYTLGRASFNMFKPGNLKITIQNTMNIIEPVCSMEKAPSAAPWSLRRELAHGDDPESHHIGQAETMLKSYDIMVALTIEPGQLSVGKDKTPSPPYRLRASYQVNGYFLPDPVTPGRLTVWFTGGRLSPAPPQGTGEASTQTKDATVDEWIKLFGAEHRRTWGEALSDMGAKLFLGASLPDGMDPDGTMSYSLHRPYGGHGKGYVDVVYADHELLITKGNSGTLHIMIKS